MTERYYRRHIFCCTNQRPDGHPRGCCGSERGLAIRARFQQRIKGEGIAHTRASKSLCLDRCEHGPCVVIYPDAVWYRIEDVERDVDEIVSEHLLGGRPVERLRLPDRADDPHAR